MWWRIGIVMTILWMIGGTLGFHMQVMNQRVEYSGSLYKFCVDGIDRLEQQYPDTNYTKDREACSTRSRKYLASETPAATVFWQCLGVTTILAIVAWVLVLIGVFTVRWILAGREGQEDSAARSFPPEV